MTCVVALKTNKNEVILGGDSFCGTEEMANLCNAPKVYQVGPIGFGICGSVRTEQIFERTVRKLVPKQTKITESWLINELTDAFQRENSTYNTFVDEEASANESSFIVAFNGKIFLLQDDFSLWETARPYVAIGSGKQYALGALAALHKTDAYQDNPAKLVLNALEVSAEWSPWVRPPYTLIII